MWLDKRVGGRRLVATRERIPLAARALSTTSKRLVPRLIICMHQRLNQGTKLTLAEQQRQ